MEPEEMALLAEEAAAGPLVENGGGSLEACQEFLDQDLVFALKTLADEERAVLLLRAIGGFRYQEIAEALGMP